MGGEIYIYVAIGICIFILLWVIFQKEVKKLIINLGMGIMIIIGVNYVVPELAIGINELTIGTVTLLGLPGVVTLYILKFLM